MSEKISTEMWFLICGDHSLFKYSVNPSSSFDSRGTFFPSDLLGWFSSQKTLSRFPQTNTPWNMFLIVQNQVGEQQLKKEKKKAKKPCTSQRAVGNGILAHACGAQHSQDRQVGSHPPTVLQSNCNSLITYCFSVEWPDPNFDLIEPSPMMSQNAAAETFS